MVVFFCEEKIRSRTCLPGFAIHAGWLVARICLGNEASYQRAVGEEKATTNRCGGKFEEVEFVYVLKKRSRSETGSWQLATQCISAYSFPKRVYSIDNTQAG